MSVSREVGAIFIGHWWLHPTTGELTDGGETRRLEPKMVELLQLLAEQPGNVVSRDDIMLRLWPQTVVGDDTLARIVSKLRKALGDDGKQQQFIETLPKRGYRLVAPVRTHQEMPLPKTDSIGIESPAADDTQSALFEQFASTAIAADMRVSRWRNVLVTVVLLLVASILLFRYFPTSSPPVENTSQQISTRANDFYAQYSRSGNESAISLFEQLIASKPDYAPAYAGLANALVQKVIRWQRPAHNHSEQADYTNLGAAIANGHTRTDAAQELLSRAAQLAQYAVQLEPDNAESWKALGFVQSAREQFEPALASYQQAIQLDGNAWGAMINIADVLEITGRNSEALPYLEAAYEAMTRVYPDQSARVLPWFTELGVLIGDRHRSRGDVAKAEFWYRRVLDQMPLHAEATRRMAELRWQAGDHDGARKLCEELSKRLGGGQSCELPTQP
ncbi:winged helix-turn-helix domain-containing protein [Permianibacter aggregans]|uniref:DNA-binding winged helix-turn-helix (WHTH) protein n=1 Tax=Permianibacter aggregans TaxID=1510150 RepID=A0A4R6UIL0_9GAMM|nr:transcriptional regulator [Permianibacter aggregans]QGX39814.1 tetratricopeptide repeat protein [Permianibacter aggregans]TDQ45906.1 DNA-binding winged helix-turn-helix (wHTH) protein [Permianibacter aggregans]